MGNMFTRFLNLVEDHVELAHLEYRYESSQTWRKLGFSALAAFCAVTAIAFFQIAMIIGLVKAGVPLYALCLLFGGLYSGGAAWIYMRYGNRDKRVGEPFQGSREELARSFQWIHHLLS